jgi:hypothetical protein
MLIPIRQLPEEFVLQDDNNNVRTILHVLDIDNSYKLPLCCHEVRFGRTCQRIFVTEVRFFHIVSTPKSIA